MKKLLFFVYAMMIAVVSLFAQAPQKFSYQAVLRDAGGNLAANQNVSVRISIVQENEYGASVYVETHSVTTNANGLVTIEVGAGNPILGSFADIDWSYGSYYLKSEVDPAGGNNYSITGVQQLLSVPYALYAGNTTGGFSGDYNDLINTPDIPTVPTNVSAFNNDAQYITQSALGSTLQGYATVGSIPTVPTNISAFVNDRGYITSSGVPTNVAAFENDAHYITEAQFNTILSALNTTLDSLRGRIAELEAAPPTSGSVTISPVSNITEHTAVCGGEVLTDGGMPIIERGICWSTSHNPTISNSRTMDGAGVGAFTSTINGLTAGTTYYVRAYAVNSVGTAYSGEISFTTVIDACLGVTTVTDIDGNVYNTLSIGNQCWMKENLRTTKYADGTTIASGSGTSTTVAYYYSTSGNFNNGKLYNWKAVMRTSSSSAANPSGVQGICPDGWHVPSDAEWNQLTEYVSSQSQYCCSNNPENIAKALASISNWNSCSTICAVGDTPSNNNATGFSALPVGGYYVDVHSTSGNGANFWSATESSSSNAYNRNLNYNNATVNRYSYGKSSGYSVRCVRD